MPTFQNPAFQRLADSLSPQLSPAGANAFGLVFDDDLPVTVTLHPNGAEIGADVWCHDAAALAGAPRRAVVQGLLMLNAAVQAGQPFTLGLDSRDFVLLHGRERLDRLEGNDAFATWLAHLVDQGRRVRALVRTLAIQDARLAFSLAGRAAAASPHPVAGDA